MAFTLTERSGARNSGLGVNSPATSTSITLPAADDEKLLLMYALTRDMAGGFDSVSDTFPDSPKGTWTELGVSGASSSTNNERFTAWARTIGTGVDSSAGVITATYTGTFKAWAVGIITITGHDPTSFNGVDATDNPVYQTASGTVSPTLSGATADSLTIALYQCNNATVNWTPNNSFTELISDYNFYENLYGPVHYKENDANASADFDVASVHVLGWATEILPASVAPNPVFTTGHAQRNVRHSGRY